MKARLSIVAIFGLAGLLAAGQLFGLLPWVGNAHPDDYAVYRAALAYTGAPAADKLRSDGARFTEDWIRRAPFAVRASGGTRLSPITYDASRTVARLRISRPDCDYGAWYDLTLDKTAFGWRITEARYGGEGWC